MNRSQIDSLAIGRHSCKTSPPVYLKVYANKDGQMIRTFYVRYKQFGKDVTYTLGDYPKILLRDAVKLASARLANAKLNPPADTNNTAGTIRLGDWLMMYGDSKLRAGKWTEAHHKKTLGQLKLHLSRIWRRYIEEITPAVIVGELERSNKVGTESGRRVFQWVSVAMDEALGLGKDVSAFPRKVPTTLSSPKPIPLKAILDLAELRKIYQDVWLGNYSFGVRSAHSVIASTALRVGSVVTLRIADLHLEAKEPHLIVKRENLKRKDMHNRGLRVNLYGHTVEVLKECVMRAQRNKTDVLFPSPTDERKEISSEALEKLIKRLTDGRHTIHGWRSSFSTILRQNKIPKFLTEECLDHIVMNEVAQTYDRIDLPSEEAQDCWKLWTDLLHDMK